MDMLLQLVLLLFQLLQFCNSYNLYSVIDQTTGIPYDCIYNYLDPDFFKNNNHIRLSSYQLTEQIIPYCLIVKQIINEEEFCVANGGVSWSFKQLINLNITSNDLIYWNATVNIIDEYEHYLHMRNDDAATIRFCNCTDRFRFGTYCQYTFALKNESFNTILKSHFHNLEEMSMNDVTMMTDMDITCYSRNVLCYGGCLDWRQICNGIVDCSNYQDEISCETLELNECHQDEYRCRSGHCIPLLFAFDTIFDCADGSDEQTRSHDMLSLRYCYRQTPNMFCDDFNNARLKFPCGDGESILSPFHGCYNKRYSQIRRQLYISDKTPCSQYMLCLQSSNFWFPWTINCNELCNGSNDCLSYFASLCYEETILFPSKPLMLSPLVYFVYRVNATDHDSPHFICYTECDHLYPPTSKQHGHSCRSMAEFHDRPFNLSLILSDLVAEIHHFFAGCNSRHTISNNSLLFRCPLTDRLISRHRTKDGFPDCYMGFDETLNESICLQNSNHQFRCWVNSDECIRQRFVQDGIHDCSDKSDEPLSHTCDDGTELACDYRRGIYQPKILFYEFEDICDGYPHKPSLLQFLNGTDETDCEDFWCLSMPSVRCDGYWHCADGRDELNCSLASLPDVAKASKLLHTLNNCSVMEHFCLHTFNQSNNASRSCIPLSLAGNGQIDCLGAVDERHTVCDYRKFSSKNLQFYRCAGQDNQCIQLARICNGYPDCPMGDDEKLCEWLPMNISRAFFFCRNGTKLIRARIQCNGILDCVEGEDEWFCDLQISGPQIQPAIESKLLLYPPNLGNISIPSIYYTRNHNRVTMYSYVKSNWYCNRGISIIDVESYRCLCPSSYYGERCENQRKRISVVVQIVSPPLLKKHVAIKLILYLIDNTTLKILDNEEVLHFPYIHYSYKHLVTLSSSRADQAFVRIDTYEVDVEQVLNYRGSWKFDIPFPFLPVRRLAVRLVISGNENLLSPKKLSCPTCIHGQCLLYQNSAYPLCRCYNGWTGFACNESLHCASGAVSINPQRCLCPMNRHGTRCYVPNIVICLCQNGGTCISLDARTAQSVCLCTDQHYGQYCERQHASLSIIEFDRSQPKVLPIVLMQFIGINRALAVKFENVFLFERVLTNRELVLYHENHENLPILVLCKVFYSSSNDDYAYYIVLQIPFFSYNNNFRPKHVQSQIETQQKCFHIREMEIFQKPRNILAYPHIKRIKFYLRGCINNTTRCFYDEIYLCFCPIRDDQTASCIIYDHNREKCKPPNSCLNGGLCVENRRGGFVDFVCLCPTCYYYGSMCQFSIGQHQGLSLDVLVGIEMRTGKSLSEQSIMIKVIMSILICMITFGSIGNILCIITFLQKKSRTTGCGYYLFIVSVCNQLVLVVLGLRFVYVLVTQMIVWKNRSRSLILCKSLDFGLILLPNLSDWLSACVSVERTFAVLRGVLFNKEASIRVAKRLCVIVIIILSGLTVPEILSRQLINDPRLGGFTWCISELSAKSSQKFKSTLSIIHLLGPFLIHSFSSNILIATIARNKLAIRKDGVNQSFGTMLRTQISHYKHLIISPMVLLILAVPRLIISFGSLCIDSSWRNYAFLFGYFISFTPLMGTIFIFVLPAPVYRDELKHYLSNVRVRFIHQ